MTIKELLGIPERTILSFVKSAYKLNINPLPLLRKRFPDVPFHFTCNVFQKYASDAEDEGKNYILVVKDDENGVIEARVETYFKSWVHNPEHIEMPEVPNI